MTSPPRSVFPWLTVVAVLVVALSLRGPIVAPTVVLDDIEQDLGIDPAVAGLIIAVPVLMFAALTPLAAILIRRAGAEVAVVLTLTGVLLGTVLRTIPGLAGMLVGMLVIGASITIGNIVVPVIIRRDVPARHVSVVTAAYTACLNAGSLVTALLTAPLAALVGWPLALLAWGVLTIGGVVLWIVHMRRDRTPGARWQERDSGEAAPAQATTGAIVSLTGPLPVVEHSRGAGPVWRMPVAWLLTGAFAAQSCSYYVLTTWLPTIADDELGLGDLGAGALASAFQGIAIVGAFTVPLVARFAPPIVAPVMISACWLATGVGLLFAPSALPLWIAIGAIAHSGGFVVIFTRLVQVARSDRIAAGMSALVQGVGYASAAIAPPLIGALHSQTGGWTAPLAVIAVVTALYGVFVLAAHLRRWDGPLIRPRR